MGSVRSGSAAQMWQAVLQVEQCGIGSSRSLERVRMMVLGI